MSAVDIFGVDASRLWTTYEVELEFRDLVVGGVPSDPSVIRKWLTARLDMGDAALEETIAETIESRDAVLSVNDKIDALMATDKISVNGFKRNSKGELCLEGRTLKAAIKEAANSAYPGAAWPGKTAVLGKNKSGTDTFRKGLMSTLVERVFVTDILVGLGVTEPTEIEERVKHVKTPQGPRSALNRVEVVQGATVTFTVKVRDDFLPQEAWARIWSSLEEIGLGSDRARSDGRFDLLRWDRQ